MNERFDASLDVRIPMDLLREFEKEPRIVIRHPWLVGIPAPELLRTGDIAKRFEQAGFEIFLVPKSVLR